MQISLFGGSALNGPAESKTCIRMEHKLWFWRYEAFTDQQEQEEEITLQHFDMAPYYPQRPTGGTFVIAPLLF